LGVYYQSRSIILKTMDYKEADKIVSVFSEGAGKISAVARGIKKPKSSLRACVQPFCHSLLYYRQGKDMDLITQGRLIDFYGNTREDISGMLHAVYIMELLDKALMDRMPLKNLYQHTLQVLDFIDQFGINPLVIRQYELQLLVCLGYSPGLNTCVSCGNPQVSAFDLAQGGIVCSDCLKNSATVHNISAETLAILRLSLHAGPVTLSRVKASASSQQQLETLLEAYLEYYLERKFNVTRTIKSLKDKMMI